MKQHSVPENIMDVEFKLFGSLTAKQFGYIIGGAVLGLFLFFMFKEIGSMLLAWIFAALSVILGLSLSLVRINNQPFEVWLGNFLAAMFTSQKRVWRKEKKTPEGLVDTKVQPTVPSPSIQRPPQQQQPAVQPSIPKHPFKAMNQNTQNRQQIVAPQKGGMQNMPNLPKQQGQQIPTQQQGNSSNPTNSSSMNSSSATGSQSQSDIAGEGKTGEYRFIPGSAQGAVKVTSNQSPNRPVSLGTDKSVSNSDRSGKQSAFLHSEGNSSSSGQVSNISEGKGNSQLPTGSNDITSSASVSSNPTSVNSPVSPQSSSDQNQQQGSSQLQKTSTQQSSVDLPQSVSTEPPKAYINKAMQYGDVVPHIPPKANAVPTVSQDEGSVQPSGSKSNDQNDLEEENQALRQKVAEYSENKGKLEADLIKANKMYEELRAQNEQLLEQMNKLRGEFQSLKQEKAIEQKTIPPLPPGPSTQEVQAGGMLSPKVYNGPFLSKKPNVISGIVKAKDGNLIPGVVVIVKNDKNRPVRAMKTNSLGQFVTTTSLENGVYSVELSKQDYSFGKYEVKLTGEVLPTYEFIAD